MAENDIFIANKVYPDAKRIFVKHNTIDEIKDDCCLVLDTNVLLFPYTVGKRSLEEIRKTYSRLIGLDRLIIPGQVTREFVNNRPKKIAELFQKLTRSKNHNLDLGKYPLLEGLPDYREALELNNKIKELYAEYDNKISSVLDTIKSWRCDDPVSLMYVELFNPDIIIEPSIVEEDIKKELACGKAHKIPPGYKDGGKDDEGIGDLLIWKTILEVGSSRKKSVIFVSGEEKSDWWYRTENQTLSPRYELVDEFARISNGQAFHIVNLSTMLTLFGVADKVIEEVRKEEEIQRILSNVFLKNSLIKKKLIENRKNLANQKLIKHLKLERQKKEESYSDEEMIDHMVGWFLSNYKLPADGVPYDGREGGYIYFNGGPYEPREVLSEEFSGISDDLLDYATKLIYEEGGDEWIKNEDY